MLSRAYSHGQVSDDLKRMTGYQMMAQSAGSMGVNSLESRSLKERMERHRAISELLKIQEPDSDDEFEEQFARKNLSVIDQEIQDSLKADQHREFQELTQSIILEAKYRFVKEQKDCTNDNIYEFQNFDISTGTIVLRRILDANGILLQNINSNKSSNYRKMFYDKFSSDWMFIEPQ